MRCFKAKMAGAQALAGLLLAWHASAALACRVAPAAQLEPVDAQVSMARDVALGQVIGATPLDAQTVEYRFLVLDQVAGPAQQVFTVVGRPGGSGDRDTSFDGHADFAFWARGGGRTMNGTDCVIHPSFVVGNSYLVFLGQPATRRSFEQIDMVDGAPDPHDRWLAYVRAALAQRQPFDAVAAAPDARAGPPEYERIGRFIYAFHRFVPRDDLDRQALAGRVPQALLLRVGALADEYDRIVHDSARVPDAEMAATLHEAAAVGAALAPLLHGEGR